MTAASKKVAICRGSLAWLGRQTHNLENINGGQTPMSRSRGLEAKIKRESRSRHHLFLMLMLFVWNFVNKKRVPLTLLFMFACTTFFDNLNLSFLVKSSDLFRKTISQFNCELVFQGVNPALAHLASLFFPV